MIILIILILLIAIIISSIQYYKAYARLHSHTSFDAAARQKMSKLRYENPTITCDYCGSAIDTSKDKVCPHCGADYGKDQEWVKRFHPDQEWIDEEADKEAAKEIKKAEKEAKAILKRIKMLALALFLIIAGILILAAIGAYLTKQDQYIESQELNEYSYEHYEKTDYEILGDGIILDQAGMLIQIEGIYYDQDNDNVKIGYQIQNNNNYDCRFSLHGLAINGYAHDFSFFYDTIRKNSDITLYGIAYNISKVETLTYGNISVKDTDYEYIYESEDILQFETSINSNTAPLLSDGTVLFDNDLVTIMGLGYNEDNEYAFEILNKTEETLEFTCRDGKFKENAISIYGNTNEIIPGKCVCDQASLHVYDDAFTNRKANENLSVNFEFTDTKKPEYNFSTGYIEIK